MATEKNTKKDEEETPNWTIWAAGSYAFVILLVGLPLWWHTTTVQRVPLPYHDMLNLQEQLESSFLIQVPLILKGFSTQFSPSEEAHLEKYKNIDGHTFSFTLTKSSALEMDVIYKTADLYEMDKKMCSLSTNSKSKDNEATPLTVFYVGRADFLKKLGHRVIVGNCRSVYYVSNSAKITKLDTIMKTVKKVVGLRDEASLIDPQKQLFEDGSKLQLLLPLSAGYNILFSLLVPEPEVLDSTWNIEKGIEKYVNPMLHKLDSFADFSVRSQVLYYVKLNVNPKLNRATGVYEIPYEQLPLVINPVESKLTSFVSQNPALNFLVYTAPCDKWPLQILDSDGSSLSSNAFLVPQWGGIFVYNPPCSDRSNETFKAKPYEVSVEDIMAVMISQFRSLIGLPETQHQTDEDDILDFRGSALRDWEVDWIIRKRLRKLLFTASNTLNSLGKLLDTITNIVVTEEVGDQVEESVRAIKLSFSEALNGKLTLAQANAITAFKSSEIAFHHPKNLAQLYFPDDQKYAIYIPLFLPIGIPVLLSLRFIFRHLFAKRNASSEGKIKAE